MKGLLKSKLVLSLVAVIMIAAAAAIPLLSGSISRSHAAGIVIPTVTLSPTSGAPSTSVVATGTSWIAESPITITFNNTVLLTFTPPGTSPTGEFADWTRRFIVPSIVPGKYQVIFTQRAPGIPLTVKVPFTVTSSIVKRLSGNYAGYSSISTKSQPVKYTDVKGSWIVPSVDCKSPHFLPPTPRVGFWVGLGGVLSQSNLQQIGTLTECGLLFIPHYDAFYELFPDAAPVIIPEPVNAGDHVQAEVKFVGHGLFVFKINDSTQGWKFSTLEVENKARLDSAECVAEAPGIAGNKFFGSQYPLANFGTVDFTSCLANNLPIDIAGSVTYKIVMTDKGQLEAKPSGLTNGTDFSVKWIHD